MTIYSDYDNYFTGTPTATQTPFGGGSLFKNNADTATFTDPTGKKTVIGQGSNLQDLYNTNPYIAHAWGSNPNYDLSGWQNTPYSPINPMQAVLRTDANGNTINADGSVQPPIDPRSLQMPLRTDANGNRIDFAGNIIPQPDSNSMMLGGVTKNGPGAIGIIQQPDKIQAEFPASVPIPAPTPVPVPNPVPIPEPTPAPAPIPTPVADNSFTLPTDVYSSSGSSGSSLNLSDNQSQSNSGINWDNPLNKGILQSLINSGQGLQGYTDQLGADLTAKYNNQMRRAMDPSNFQGLLNSLSNRRMINSDVAGDAFGTAGAEIIKSIADKAFDAQVLQSQAQMNVPTILAQLATLGQESSASSSGSGLGVSTNESYASDPFEPYRAMADLMMFQPTV